MVYKKRVKGKVNMAHSSGGPFTQAFREALAHSGMTLVEVVEALSERGVKLTQASLSYWQSGRSVPRRQSSIAVLGDVEKVLGVKQGALKLALEHEREEYAKNAELTSQKKGSSQRPELLWNAPRGVDAGLIDWANEVQRKFIHQTMTIRDGGRKATTRIDAVVRVSGEQSPTLSACASWSLGDDIPEVRDVYGGNLDEPHVDEGGRFAIFPIALPEERTSGELHQLGYTIHATATDRITQTPQGWFARPVDMYAFTVDFGDELPMSVEWVNVTTRRRGDAIERVETTHDLDIIDGIVQSTVEHLNDSATFIRWSW